MAKRKVEPKPSTFRDLGPNIVLEIRPDGTTAASAIKGLSDPETLRRLAAEEATFCEEKTAFLRAWLGGQKPEISLRP